MPDDRPEGDSSGGQVMSYVCNLIQRKPISRFFAFTIFHVDPVEVRRSAVHDSTYEPDIKKTQASG